MKKKRDILRFTTWVHLINVMVIFIVYGIMNDCGVTLAPLVGFWGIFQLCYRIFYQFLGFDRIFCKKDKDKDEKCED